MLFFEVLVKRKTQNKCYGKNDILFSESVAHTFKAGSEGIHSTLLQGFDPRSSDAPDSAADMM